MYTQGPGVDRDTIICRGSSVILFDYRSALLYFSLSSPEKITDQITLANSDARDFSGGSHLFIQKSFLTADIHCI